MIALKESPGQSQSYQHMPLTTELPGHDASPVKFKNREPFDITQWPGGKIKRILVPTDFSQCSDEAVTRAAELARRYNASLTILHVIDINSSTAATHCGTADDLMKHLWETGISGLHRLTESLAKIQIRAETRILEGLPAEAIVENSSDFDLLVICPPRSKSAWRLFSSRTAQRIIERAECPVLVVDEKTGFIARTLKPA
jgi:nucleotide-binding universal stress UspA family protein